MKRIATILSTSLGFALLASVASAQNGPAPDITTIPQRQANAPGNIVINGTNLGLASDVKINNVSVPIIRVRPDRIIVGPLDPQLPGFATVKVIAGNNNDSGTLSLLPTLLASRRGFVVFPTINNGDSGTYILRHSYQADLANATQAGIYGRRFLSATATVASAGIIPDSNPFPVMPFALPIEIGLIGEDLKLQAECYANTSGLTRFTNLAAVTGFGNPQ